MKRTTTHALVATFSLGLLLSLGLLACDALDRQNAAPGAVARVDDGAAALLVSPDNAEGLLRAGLSRANPDVVLASFDAAPTVERFGPDYFLVGSGMAEGGGCVTVAVALEQAEGGLLGRLTAEGAFQEVPPTHTCTGQNCSRCILVYDGGFYCNCSRPGGGTGNSWCDHTCSGNC